MLQAQDLTLWRGNTCLFQNLSFHVDRGTALLVRGPNGVGKTTLLRVVCGLTQAESGAVLWRGEAASRSMRGDVAYGGHHPALKAELTVRQNLSFYSRFTVPAGDWAGPLRSLGLTRCADLEARYLSAGQRRRAGLARVFMSRAPLWLLDEPFTNLDSDGRRLVEERIGAHLESGGLALVVAHHEIALPAGRSQTLDMGSG